MTGSATPAAARLGLSTDAVRMRVRRGLMDQIAALTAGEAIEAAEPRPNADRTEANADAQMQPPQEQE